MEKEIKEISDYLNTTCSNNPAEIQERISVIMVYMMRTGEMLAEAKKILRKKKSDEIQNMIIRIAKENCLSAKVQNALLDSIAEDDAIWSTDWTDSMLLARINWIHFEACLVTRRNRLDSIRQDIDKVEKNL